MSELDINKVYNEKKEKINELDLRKVFKEMDDDYSSERYNEYLEKHIQGVHDAYEWIERNLPELLSDVHDIVEILINFHDNSKYQSEELLPYARYFYPANKVTEDIEEDFNKAWLHHIHENKHHWNHWVIVEDGGKLKPLDMPKEYIIEMVCDHFSFAFTKNNPKELFDWYDKNKNKMILSSNTRKEYENILNKIKEKLEILDYFGQENP